MKTKVISRGIVLALFSLLPAGLGEKLEAQEVQSREVVSVGDEHTTPSRSVILERIRELNALSMAARENREGSSVDRGSEFDESWVLEARFEIRKLMLVGAAIENPVERRRYYRELRRLNASLLEDLEVAEIHQTRKLEKP